MMFEGEAHASYIALCRELRLEREFKEGDWYWSGPPREYVSCCHGFHVDRQWSAGCVWLPRLDQWMTMLEEAGIEAVLFSRAEGVCQVLAYPLSSIHALEPGPPSAPTREEAAARLWVAVTGRTVASG